MPNIKSAKKRLRQNVVLRDRNRAARSVVRNRIKNLLKLLRAGDIPAAEQQYRSVCSALDRAAAKKLWHKNNTSRRKSRLARLIVKIKAQKANS